jgi:adenylate cyclase
VITPALAYVVRYFIEARQRQRLQDAFGHYLAPALVARLARDVSALGLGGERREVTVMFADLSGFTAVSEQGHWFSLMGIAKRLEFLDKLGYLCHMLSI